MLRYPFDDNDNDNDDHDHDHDHDHENIERLFSLTYFFEPTTQADFMTYSGLILEESIEIETN